MKNEINLQKYFLLWELEQEITGFFHYYNNRRRHESVDNVAPADLCFGRHQEIITRGEQLKRQTLKARKYYNLSANNTLTTVTHLINLSLNVAHNLSRTF